MKTMKRLLILLAALAVFAGVGFWLRPVSYLNQLTYLHESLSGVSNHSVRAAGYRIHYLAEGPRNGPVVVLVHGLGGRAEDWINLAPWLAKAGFRVYMPDLPGYGRSEKPANFSYSVPDEAAVVVAFMDELGLSQVDLGGWSMGGWVVQIVAGAHPERVKRLMLFDSAGIYVKPSWNTSLFMPTSADELNQLEALLMPNPPQIPGFITNDLLRLSKERAWIIRRAIDSMLTGTYVTDNLLPQLKMPVLIVWGGEDRITPTDLAQKMHHLVPQSELHIFPGCGHLAAGQCAGQVGPKVVDFVKQ